MRQVSCRGVAPQNDNPRWPAGYEAVLREAGAQEKTIPYYLTWVRRFFANYPGRSRRSLGRAEVEAFLSATTLRATVSNWQIAQARAALELYYEQFRGIALAPRPDRHDTTTASLVSTQPSEAPAPSTRTAERSPAKANTQSVAPYQGVRSGVNAVVREGCAGGASAFGDGAGGAEAESARSTRTPPARSAGGTGRVADGVAGAVGGKTNWRLLEARVRECLRVGHYSYRTEQTYLGWIRQFVEFHQGQKPSTMSAGHVQEFLKHLAMDRQVASSTQNQALNAVVFLFKLVIKKDIGDFSDFQRARRGLRLPVVASREEIKAIIEQLSGRERFMGALLYGTGMRINELLRLRVQDVQFDHNRLMVRAGKGDKDRYVPFPTKYRDEMQAWLKGRREQYEADKARNQHEVEVPGALALKYPGAPWEWRWQYVFAADDFSEDPRSGHVRRHHVDGQHLQRAVREAVRAAGLTIRFTPHCFRHYAEFRIMPSSLPVAA